MLYPLSYEGLCACWKLLGAAGRARIQAYKLPGQPPNTDSPQHRQPGTTVHLTLGWPA